VLRDNVWATLYALEPHRSSTPRMEIDTKATVPKQRTGMMLNDMQKYLSAQNVEFEMAHRETATMKNMIAF
jgi:hypothetical protein